MSPFVLILGFVVNLLLVANPCTEVGQNMLLAGRVAGAFLALGLALGNKPVGMMMRRPMIFARGAMLRASLLGGFVLLAWLSYERKGLTTPSLWLSWVTREPRAKLRGSLCVTGFLAEGVLARSIWLEELA